jgi:shikimate kinase/3-dehydroquinate synthase
MLVFTGFMGAGKTTASKTASRHLDVEPLDADVIFEERHGPIEHFFSSHGEAAFREREESIVLELLDRGEGVLSLGGGAVESPRIRDALRSHRVVWLDVDPDVAWQRATRGAQTVRPLARDRDAFMARFEARRPLYESLADAVLPGGTGVERALPWIEALPGGARMVWAPTDGGQYPVIVGSGVRTLDAHMPGRRFLVTDDVVGPLWAGDVPHDCRLVVWAGEEHKTLAAAEHLWRELARMEATRGDHVCALGGGVVGDLAGFVASAYQRGVPVVQIPTTIVAQVDAAIGGKTGVDLPEGKNYVGAFHQPRAVLADTEVLATLPDGERAAGYAEVVKTALIAGGRLWERVAAGAPVDADTVFACALTKVRVVAADERDGGVRQVLNLGHTVGHALETITGYRRLRHGEAVGLGLLAALRLSGQDALRRQVAGLLAGAGLPTRIDGIDPGEVVAATKRDKKRAAGDSAVPFVLVEAPGSVVHGAAVADDAVQAAVEELAR